ncbi:MAG: hypothetical protein QOD28_1251 [Acidobacteriota bacterium]|nr:hypothetical protein [Acidobacteriota bacterium]
MKEADRADGEKQTGYFLEKVIARIRESGSPHLEIYEEDNQRVARFAFGGDTDPGVFVAALHITPHLESWARAGGLEIATRIAREQGIAPEDSEISDTLAEMLAWSFVMGLPGKIREALGELTSESAYIVETGARGLINRINQQSLGDEAAQLPDIKSEVKSYARSLVKEREGFLLKTIERFTRPDWQEIAAEHDRLRPIWEEAKIAYEQNKSRPHWKEIVALAMKDTENLPADLIASLSGDLTDFPEDLQTKWAAKLGDTKPAYIALHHAARLCGVPPYSLGTSRMYQLIRDSRDGGIIREDK